MEKQYDRGTVRDRDVGETNASARRKKSGMKRRRWALFVVRSSKMSMMTQDVRLSR